MSNIKPSEFESKCQELIDTITDGGKRTVYTHHHDYVRQLTRKFGDSRSEVANYCPYDENQLYATALIAVVDIAGSKLFEKIHSSEDYHFIRKAKFIVNEYISYLMSYKFTPPKECVFNVYITKNKENVIFQFISENEFDTQSNKYTTKNFIKSNRLVYHENDIKELCGGLLSEINEYFNKNPRADYWDVLMNVRYTPKDGNQSFDYSKLNDKNSFELDSIVAVIGVEK